MDLYAPHRNLEKEKLLGLISDDLYYTLKIREAAARYDVYEQKRWIDLKHLERRIKEQKAEEERQRQEKEKKEQEKALKEAIEKELPKALEKELSKQIEKAFL